MSHVTHRARYCHGHTLAHQEHVDRRPQRVLTRCSPGRQVEQHAAIHDEVDPGVAGEGIEHDVALRLQPEQRSTEETHASVQDEAATCEVMRGYVRIQ